MTQHPRTRAVAALVRAGVPMDRAERMPPWQLLTYQVIFGELEGGEFDWKGLRWKDPK
jgi:hypothetical protein